MTKVVVRPASAQDLDAFSDLANKPTTRAWCAEINGRIVGLGGIAAYNGRWYAFVDLLPEIRPHKMTIARAAARFLDAARRDGVKFIYAEVSPREPGALRWLMRLGFRVDSRSNYYRWSADARL
mgnify:CR=1 FL=1